MKKQYSLLLLASLNFESKNILWYHCNLINVGTAKSSGFHDSFTSFFQLSNERKRPKKVGVSLTLFPTSYYQEERKFGAAEADYYWFFHKQPSLGEEKEEEKEKREE